MTLQKTDLSVSPYFDDYDEKKKFNRVLFRPRVVQARELNQLQSILQDQVNRFGKHLFAEGSPVLRGGMNVVEKQASVSFTLADGFTVKALQTEAETLTVHVRNNLGVTAKCVRIMDVELFDPAYLFVDYETSGSDGSVKFAVGDALSFFVHNADGTEREIAAGTANIVGVGAWARILEGVYFVRGAFVLADQQDIVIAKNNENANVRVCFNVVERIITEIEDATLYSNALGAPNFKAPGASRLVFDLVVVARDLALPMTDNLIELLRIENGVLQKKVSQTEYSVLADTLAQRTYEESGDYTVDAFDIDVKEHLKDEDHDGVFTPEQGGDESKFVVRVKPGIGYVKGYRVQSIGLVNLPVDKARETQTVNNTALSADYGAYFIVQNTYSMPSTDLRTRYQLKDAVTGGGSVVGTCAIRSVRKEGTNTYRLYVTDLQMVVGKTVADVKSVYFADANNLFRADLTQSVLFEGSKRQMIFNLPYDTVETLKPGGVSDTTFTVMRSFDLTTDGSGNVSVPLGSTELFGSVNSFEWFLANSGSANNGTIYDPTGKVTLGGTPTGRMATIALGAVPNQKIKLIAPVIKQSPSEKSKILKTFSETIVVAGKTTINLSKTDVVSLTSVRLTNANGANITANFSLDGGQRDEWYEVGKLNSLVGSVTNTLYVTYEYFEHTAGDYFSVDSYATVDRASIPSYNGKSLADVLDFRPDKDVNGNIILGGASTDVIKPGDSIRMDLEYYMGRIDSVYVDADGNFGVQRGLSSDTPQIPSIPDNAMRLYNLEIPAYTLDVTKIKQGFIENKRYTMRDIGKLEKRIENLEYYTSLSMLENSVNNTQVIDPITGTNRFKNGFAVDNFSDLKLADIMHPEWDASFDLDAERLVAGFSQNASDMIGVRPTGTTKRNELWLLAYNEAVETSQLMATQSINVNPYAVFTWSGQIALTPATDFWKDVHYIDPVIINETVDLTNGAVAGVVQASLFGAWSGTTRTENHRLHRITESRSRQVLTVTTTTSISESTVSRTAADQIVATQIIPFMRAIDIKFAGHGFKPQSRVYPFFDGVDVSIYCNQDGKAKGEPLMTDKHGSVSGTFSVPNNTARSFKTGTTVFRLTESASGMRDEYHSSGDAVFTSGGTLESKQLTIVNTRTLIASSSAQATEWTENDIRVTAGDPVAQSFFVSSTGGAYLTKIDVFFRKKAVNIPVTLQLRTMVGGYPSLDRLPFGQVVLNPDQVNVSEDGSVATSFVFPDPVFVQQDEQYAIVLLAETQEYEVFIAEMGEGLLSGSGAVAKQPHIGVFFTSSNGGTWTANQMQDLKFVVYRADFAAQSGTIEFEAGAPIALPLTFNPFTTTNGSGLVTVKMRSHGLKTGDSVTFSGVVGNNGFSDEAINQTFTVGAAKTDSFEITLPSNANSNGTFGGSACKAVAAYPFTSIYSNVMALRQPGTDIKWELRYKIQSNRNLTNWVEFTPNADNYFDQEGVLLAQGDFIVRATLSTTSSNLSPCIDTAGLTTVFVGNRINADTAAPVFKYVTKSILFDNPNTAARFYVGALLPTGTTMNFYYKPIYDAATDMSTVAWRVLNPTKPIRNDSKNFIEYEYQLGGIGSFIGYQVKIEFLGSDACMTPELSDFRSIALA